MGRGTSDGDLTPGSLTPIMDWKVDLTKNMKKASADVCVILGEVSRDLTAVETTTEEVDRVEEYFKVAFDEHSG